MDHVNADGVNVECKKATTMSLLDLNDFALLCVFGYLNLKDSINFAGTSKRLKSVGALHFTKYKRFDLLKYEWSEQPKRIPAETILFHIGQHIENLTIYSMRSTVAKAVTDNCVNVTTLKLYDCKGTSQLKKWMRQLKLESLTIDRCSSFNKVSVGLASLKELHFTDDNDGLSAMQLTKILETTTNLESLKVDLTYLIFNYDIFIRLPKLQCLDIKINSEDIVHLTEYLKMDGLTQFKLRLTFNYNAEDVQRLNSFLKILAKRSKLNELELDTYTVDENTFCMLKSFHYVTSLGFNAANYVDHQWDDFWILHQLLEAQPNLKHLDFLHKDIRIKYVDFVVKNLVKLETFSFCMRDELNELRINEMLKTSTSRPMLTLYINSDCSSAIKVELRFEQRKHRIVKSVRNYAEDSYFLTDEFTGTL